MRTDNRVQWLVLWTLTMIVSLWMCSPASATTPAGSELGCGPVVNVAADGVVGCLVPPLGIDGTHSKEQLTEAFRSTIDHYADARVPYLFLNACYMRAACPTGVWDTYWDIDDPDSNASGWPRAYWLVHKKGVDPFAVCVARCRERGVSPWLSMRMNDTHYINDPTKTSKLWQQHPELRRAANSGYDFAHKQVRDHYLALVAELMDRYDCDGVELDWMRFPWHFKSGQEQQGQAALNEFMRRARQLAEQATAKRGHPVKIAARIPAVPEFAQGLGMDGVTWAREGWVDMLILASVWRPSDTDIPVERWRELIGPAADNVLLAAGTDLWLQGTPGGRLMSDDVETQRGFTAAMLGRGADLVYLFNHFNVSDFGRTEKTPDGRTVQRNDRAAVAGLPTEPRARPQVSNISGDRRSAVSADPRRAPRTIQRNDHQALLRVAGRLEASLEGPRRHVVTFHDPPAPNMPNPKQLPAELTPDGVAHFRLYTGPKLTGGRVLIRAGLDNLAGVSEAALAARLNGAECTPIEDLPKPDDRKTYTHDPHRVFHLAHLAQRMLQFQAPPAAMQRGYNQVDLRLTTSNNQKVIWLEVSIVP